MLFDFAMKSHLLEIRVIFLALQSLGGVLFIFCCDIPGDARYTALSLLSTLHYDLYSVSFSFF